jgi:hypothetical protein
VEVKVRPDREEAHRMRKAFAVSMIVGVVLIGASLPASASTGKGNLFHDGAVVGTVVVPVAIPGQGTDPFYAVTNGAAGQLGIAGVAPGDGPYHGGAWQVFSVTFGTGVTPYVLTSDEAVTAAQQTGDVTVTRAAVADFRCPVTA